jgi:hypothetical protein
MLLEGRPHLSGRADDADEIIASGGLILPALGNTEPDLEINAPRLLQLEASVRQILRPSRREADVKTG